MEEISLSQEQIDKLNHLLKQSTLYKKQQLSQEKINIYDLWDLIKSVKEYIKSIVDININSESFDLELHNKFVEKGQHFNKKIEEIESLPEREQLKHYIDMIDLMHEIDSIKYQMYYMRDLINAKEDYLKDMKYYKTPEKIEQFKQRYDQAIKEKDTTTMKRMLDQIVEEIKEEWKKTKTEQAGKFSFIGHSAKSASLKGNFQSRFVSCSLYTEEINDTYNSRFGYIMEPQNIIAAGTKDLNVRNYTNDINEVLFYSTIQHIHHPKRILEENRTQQQENIPKLEQVTTITDNIPRVYNEVAIDGFHPVGLFFFTNGALGYDNDYKEFQELKNNNPELPVRIIDIMKLKKGPALRIMQLELINSINQSINRDFPYINMGELDAYSIFLEKFDELKVRGNYTEEDVKQIFLETKALLDYIDNPPKQVFSGRYTEKEIKHILGKNCRYSIDSILKQKPGLFVIERLKELEPYCDELDKYYKGLSKFIKLLTIINIDETILDEMYKDSELNFETFSNILQTIIETKKEEQIEQQERIRQTIESLEQEKIQMQQQKEIYERSENITTREFTAQLLKKEYIDVEKEIETKTKEEENLNQQFTELEQEISELNDNEENQNKNEASTKKDIIEEEIRKLKKHPIINMFKIRNKKKEKEALEQQEKIEKQKNEKSKFERNQRNRKIEQLKNQLEILKNKIESLEQSKKSLIQEKEKIIKTIKEYFNCETIEQMESVIEQAKKYLETNQYPDLILLNKIDERLTELYQQLDSYQQGITI